MTVPTHATWVSVYRTFQRNKDPLVGDPVEACHGVEMVVGETGLGKGTNTEAGKNSNASRILDQPMMNPPQKPACGYCITAASFIQRVRPWLSGIGKDIVTFLEELVVVNAPRIRSRESELCDYSFSPSYLVMSENSIDVAHLRLPSDGST